MNPCVPCDAPGKDCRRITEDLHIQLENAGGSSSAGPAGRKPVRRPLPTTPADPIPRIPCGLAGRRGVRLQQDRHQFSPHQASLPLTRSRRISRISTIMERISESPIPQRPAGIMPELTSPLTAHSSRHIRSALVPYSLPALRIPLSDGSGVLSKQIIPFSPVLSRRRRVR